MKIENRIERLRTVEQQQKEYRTSNENAKRREKGTKEIFETIMTGNFPQINVRQQNTDPGSSVHTE